MREIKFRAWHTKLNRMFSCEEMVIDQMALLPNGLFANIHSMSTKLSVIDYNHIMIPLQFTSLNDKNGKPIYEGDIVLTDEADWIGEVVFTNGMFMVEDRKGGFASFCNWDKFSVLGNIYENEELLK